MVSSSQVGDAIKVRCAEPGAIVRSAAAMSVRAITGSLETMMTRTDHHLAIRPATQDCADHARFADATGWPPQTVLRPT